MSDATTNATTKRKKVAIIGFTEHKRLAPFTDDEWEVWGLNDLYLDLPSTVTKDRLRWFQVHSWHRPEPWKDVPVDDRPLDFSGGPPHPRDPNHVAYLREAATKFPVYVLEPHQEIPDAVVLDREAMYRYFSLDGKDPCRYFTNSISWMIGLAIMEGFEEIGIYGVDMMMAGGVGSEYGYQRPSCEWLIGVAQGRGIKVHIPQQSDLLKTAFVYGDREANPFRVKLQAMRAEYEQRRTYFQQQVSQGQLATAEMSGAINTMSWILTSWMPGDAEENRGRAPDPSAQKVLPEPVQAKPAGPVPDAILKRLDAFDRGMQDVAGVINQMGPALSGVIERVEALTGASDHAGPG